MPKPPNTRRKSSAKGSTRAAARPVGARPGGRGRAAGDERRQVLVRLSGPMADYLDAVVPERRERAAYLRRLILRDKARRERKELGRMFAAAAADVSDEERQARRALAGAFSARD